MYCRQTVGESNLAKNKLADIKAENARLELENNELKIQLLVKKKQAQVLKLQLASLKKK